MVMDGFFSPIPRNTDFRFTDGYADLRQRGVSLEDKAAFKDEFLIFLEETGLGYTTGEITLSAVEDERYGDEEYGLHVETDMITIISRESRGAHLALECLKQMFISYDGIIPCFTANDSPAFSHRGLLVDVARHFLPIGYLTRIVDAMSMLRMNVLHLHLTDDQGWRLDIPSHPEIARKGGSRKSPVYKHPDTKSLFYTEEEMKALIAHASKRHIEIIPEIDMPGHMLSLLASHPEIGCKKKKYEVETRWGIFEDVLCPAKEETYSVLEDIIAYVSDLFPSRRLHIGGDECPTEVWKTCPQCQRMLKELGLKDERELQGVFSTRISRIMDKYGLSPAAWQEAADGNPEIKPILSIWLSGDRIAEYSSKGYDMILSIHDDGAYLNYSPTTDIDTGPLYGTNTLARCYHMRTGYDLPGPGKILGGEAALWSEYIMFPFEASHFLFPRLAAVAEALWTGNGKRDYDSFLKNATMLEKLLASIGIDVRIVLPQKKQG